MPATTYLANKLLDHQLGKAAYTLPAVYVALSSTTPTTAGGNITEPSTGSYARVQTSGVTFTSSGSGTSATIPTASTTGVAVGQVVTGAGIAGNVTVVSFVTNTSVTLSSSITYTATAYSCTSWTAAASGSTSNGAVITFPQATADWATAANMTYGVLYDAASSGNALAYGALTVAKNVLNGDTMSIAIGGLTVTLT